MEIHGKQLEGTSDEEMAYMAGYAEGVHTGELIYMAYMNTLKTLCDKPSSFCTRLESFLVNNLQFMNESISKEPNSDYWQQVIYCTNNKIIVFFLPLFALLKIVSFGEN